MEIKNRIEYLDGIRGVASIMVLFSHLIQGFYPVLHTLIPSNLDDQSFLVKTIASTPFNIFYSGHFAVIVFFLISGYSISYNFLQNRSDENLITSSAFRRYFRLTIPALFSCIIAYCLLKLHLYYIVRVSQITQNLPVILPSPDFIEMIKFALYDQYFDFKLETSYNSVLWVMRFMLFGSMLIYSFLAIFGKVRNKLFFYIILIFLFHRTFYLAFILGMILCNLDVDKILQKMNKVLLFIILLISVYFSSFKTIKFPFCNILNIYVINNYFSNFLASFYNIVGAFLLIFVISRSTLLKRMFSSKIPIFIGKISFSIYLLHLIIICSLSSYIYLILINQISYNSSFFVTAIITIIITLISSYIFYNYIEVKSINWSKSLYNFLANCIK
jgi:peptidoglycan/LPS O-acetylase OafA/YrhL